MPYVIKRRAGEHAPQRRSGQWVTPVLLVVITGLTGMVWASRRSGQRLQPPRSVSVAEAHALARQYGFELVTDDEPFPIRVQLEWINGMTAEEEPVLNYLQVFCDELRVYPSALMPRIGLRRVVLCRDLTLAGRPRGGIAAPELDSFYLDVLLGASPGWYQKWHIHHELYHLVDYADDSTLNDPAWESLNAAAFSYGSGGASYQSYPRWNQHPATPGFVTWYAEAAVEEDKAETFAALMLAPLELTRRTSAEPILQRKVDLLKKQLSQLGAGLDGEFWVRLSRHRETHPVALPAGWLPE